MKRRWADRIAGILVGVAIGLGVLVYFVFVHSEGTIDAPKINESQAGRSSGEATTTPEAEGPAPSGPETANEGEEQAPEPKARPVPVVKVIGGAPPTGGGPKQLRFRVGEKVRFEIETDEPFSFEIRGLGVEETIETSSIVSFQAKRAGQFPVVASATVIGVADLLIEKKKPKPKG